MKSFMKSFIAKGIGRQIKKHRLAKNMTQAELAEKVGLAQTHISLIERGVGSNMTPSVLEKIAQVLEVEVDSLSEEDVNDEYKSDETPNLTKVMDTTQNTLNSFYPPIPFQQGIDSIATLLEFLAYLPLINPSDLYNILMQTVGKRRTRQDFCFPSKDGVLEDEIIARLTYCVSQIPKSPAKEYADWMYHQIRKIRDSQKYEWENPPLELKRAYCELIDEELDACYEYERFMKKCAVFQNKLSSCEKKKGEIS